MKNDVTFAQLLKRIQSAHQEMSAQAGRAVNISLTLRNWLIGCYIQEYELNGTDRATYGEQLLATLASELRRLKINRSDERELRRYKRFYQIYPQIRETLPPESTIQPERKNHHFQAFLLAHCRIDRHRRPDSARVLRSGMHSRELVGARTQTPDRQSLLRTLRAVG